MESTEKQISRLRELTKIVAPELSNTKIYWCEAALFDGVFHTPNSLAWATSSISPNYALIDCMEDYDEPGPIIAIYFEAVAEISKPLFRAETLLNVALHELAHVLPARQYRQPTESVEARRTVREYQVAALKVGESRDTAPMIDGEHGADFIRRAIHLWYRAEQAGYELFGGDLIAAFGSGFSPTKAYYDALRQELEELKDASFAEIEAIKPPDEFLETWQYDIQMHERGNHARYR